MPRLANVFSGPYLDRIAHLRKDAAFVAAAAASDTARIVAVHDSRMMVRRGANGWSPVYLGTAQAALLGLTTEELVLLGRNDERTYFAADIADPAAVEALVDDGPVRFEDLRVAGGVLPAHDGGILAYARAMLHWRSRHRYCGACGTATQASSAGHVMKCPNAACGIDHFPRLDPAIIVLITDGERALLGRQASWPAGRYSTIAGFVEPGESLEDAVVRESLEETGVAVTDCEYHSSQPWPFPSSLMIGFTARASADAVPRADEELEDCRWFTRAEIASGAVGVPPPLSVSFRLVEHWFDADSATPLAQTPGVMHWGGRR